MVQIVIFVTPVQSSRFPNTAVVSYHMVRVFAYNKRPPYVGFILRSLILENSPLKQGFVFGFGAWHLGLLSEMI